MTHTIISTSPNITLIESYDDVQNFFNWLSKDRQVLAFDTETEGLSFISDKIRLVQFGDMEAAWAMSWDLWKGVALEVFQKYQGDFVAHNLKFDMNFIEHQGGIRLPRDRMHDTLTMSQLCNWDVPNHKLKTLIALHIDPSLTVGQKILDDAMKKNKWTWATVPIEFEGYWVYGGLDCVLTALLYEKYEKKIKEEEFGDVYNLEMQMSSIAADMEQRGVRVDLNYCEQKLDELTQYANEVKKYCNDEWSVNPGSNFEVVKVLQADGVPLDKRTPGGSLSFDAETIERFKDVHPLVDVIYNYRKSIKLANTYFKNFLEDHREGRIHCSINTLQARTGRMSVTRPALQTLPRGDVVRRAFLPEEGHLWQSIDYSNVELRVAASFAKEQKMIELFKQGADLHGYLAEQIFKTKDYTKEQRQLAKNANFSKVYGAGVRKFAETSKISEEEARAIFDGYNETFPGMKRFADSLMEQAKDNYARDGFMWMRNPSGRRHVTASDAEYKFTNYIIQGECAEVLKKAVVRLQSSGLDKYLLLLVHDECCVSLPEDEIDFLEKEIMELMQDLNTYDVPLVVETGERGENWGASK